MPGNVHFSTLNELLYVLGGVLRKAKKHDLGRVVHASDRVTGLDCGKEE